MNEQYTPNKIEPEWQRIWEESQAFAAHRRKDQPKIYCLNYFPYPSGEGLHVGHCRNYIPTDVIARYKRMRGFNVLHPMGWDAFGEPTEQHAVATGTHPRQTTDQNTANFRRQLTLIGNGYDWSREIDTSRPEYYRWTQWFFLLLYNRGLAYRDTSWQWWCPTCRTTLSSHESSGGVCWRGHPGVTRREIPAWYFRITAYADALLEGLEGLDWPEPIKQMQRNWIGRSQGYEIDFGTSTGTTLTTFTTRPETAFGATFLALSPEHPAVDALTTPAQRSAVERARRAAVTRSEVERATEGGEIHSALTGATAANPLTGEQIPVWIADYVLPGYGTGAVMGVPAHDARDMAFARARGLPVRPVVEPAEGTSHDPVRAFTGPGVMAAAGRFTGLPSEEAAGKITAQLGEAGAARPKTHFRMRDWLISRQRYWGAPIPILYCEACGEVAVPEEQLPVQLPEMDDFAPDGTGHSPLMRVPKFIDTNCPTCEGPAQREGDTMGGFACSSWYFLRFTSPDYEQGPFEPEAMRYWMPVDLYVGGAEHAVLHLLYARFWTRVMADAGLVPVREPFQKLINQGVLHGTDGGRMSKSRGNVITPDQVVAEHGADALRLFTLAMAPFEQDVNWSTDGIKGARRFLNRTWNMVSDHHAAAAETSQGDPDLEKLLHRTIRDVTERMERFRFNTMVSTLMIFTNALQARIQDGSWQTRTFHQALLALIRLLAPAAPHLAEELWRATGHNGSVHQAEWPAWDPNLAREEFLEIPVQVDGRVRGMVRVAADAQCESVEALAQEADGVQDHLRGREVVRVVYVPKKIVNLVTK